MGALAGTTCAVISLGEVSPPCSMQPTRDWPFPQEEKAHAKTSRLPSSTDDFVPAWPCSRRGLPGHTHYCVRRWSLTPPFHHHEPHPPVRAEGTLFVSVALIRQVTPFSVFPSTRDGVSPPRVLSDAVLYGVRTFLDPDNAGPRLPNQPEVNV